MCRQPARCSPETELTRSLSHKSRNRRAFTWTPTLAEPSSFDHWSVSCDGTGAPWCFIEVANKFTTRCRYRCGLTRHLVRAPYLALPQVTRPLVIECY